MNSLQTLIWILLAAFAFLLAMPVLGAGLALLVVLACLFIWALPILLILSSEKTTGAEKTAWILAIIFLSWFAWIFYFLLAPIKPRREYWY
ncbi:MAG: hypothetical protein RQ757_02075 [Pseudomonadales bacterium]|nr:hypothetical protein [Pseudomonadales bacterium]